MIQRTALAYLLRIFLCITQRLCGTKEQQGGLIPDKMKFPVFSLSCINFPRFITTHKRILGQGTIFTDMCQSFCPQWGVCMMSLPVWLPGPMFLPGVSVPNPMFLLGISVRDSPLYSEEQAACISCYIKILSWFH